MDIGSGPFGGVGEVYPASLAQARFWVLDALDPGTPSLNVAVRWTLLGPVTPDLAEAALRRVIARHEVLRTALLEEDGTPVQIVRPAMPFRLRHLDLTGRADREEEADRIGEDEARTPFCLEVPPLIRAALITLGPDRSRLLLTLHHAVCDGWSIGVIARELLAALDGQPNPPPLVLQYADYAEWQQAWLQSNALDRAKAYWTAQLANLPYVSVEADHASDTRGPGAIASILLDRPTSDAVTATALRAGCTPFAVALAALGRVLQFRTGADDIPVGTQVAGRTAVELEEMVGPFINTLVLRLDLAGNPAWDERVSRAAAVVAGALDHHEMPFEVLIRTLNPPRVPRRTPLFSVNFIFQRSFVTNAGGGEITLVDMPSHSAGALYDLNFFMVERPEGWRASCEYDPAMYDASTVQAMLADWRTALAGQELARPAAIDTVEERLSAIWREVLAVPSVAPGDSFFDLGGHSLLAARMLARIEAVFGHRISMQSLFVDPTLAGLAAMLRGSAPDGTITRLRTGISGPTCLAIGDPQDWRALATTLARGSLICVAASDPGPTAGTTGNGPLAVLGAGTGSGAAVKAAQALQDRGEDPVLILIDGVPPRSGLMSLLRGRRAGAAFTGRAVLFSTAGHAGNGLGAWTHVLAGAVEWVPASHESWHEDVARRLERLAG